MNRPDCFPQAPGPAPAAEGPVHCDPRNVCQRDQLIVIYWLGWNLDFCDTDLRRKVGGYKTRFHWDDAGWSQEESTPADDQNFSPRTITPEIRSSYG